MAAAQWAITPSCARSDPQGRACPIQIFGGRCSGTSSPTTRLSLMNLRMESITTGPTSTSAVATIAKLKQKSLQHSCFAIFCMSSGEALSSPWTWSPFVISWWSSDGTVVDVAIDPCIAAEAAGNEYPASDAMITNRSRTSIFANVIRYIPMPEDYHQPGSCQLRASSSR